VTDPRTTTRRAGQYVLQPPGYRAFIPKPLPPDPPIRVDAQLQALLSDADRALGRLDEIRADILALEQETDGLPGEIIGSDST